MVFCRGMHRSSCLRRISTHYRQRRQKSHEKSRLGVNGSLNRNYDCNAVLYNSKFTDKSLKKNNKSDQKKLLILLIKRFFYKKKNFFKIFIPKKIL